MSQPAYLKALKSYTRDKYRSDSLVEMAVEDITRESDRGAAIIQATSVEDHLEWAIMQRMKPLWTDTEAREQMFGSSGTNSAFSAKILLAYSLGIIDREARRQIDLVREVRNACAHARLPVSFDHPSLAGITAIIAAEHLALMVKNKPGAHRHAFILACVDLNQYIATGERPKATEALAEALALAQQGQA